MKYLKNKRGDILGWVVVLAAVSIIAATVIPRVNTALEVRKQITIDNYNGTDTITEFE